MKYTITILSLLLAINAHSQSINQEVLAYKIDGSIQKEVEENTSKKEAQNPFGDLFLVYGNLILADVYANDSLVMSTKNQNQGMPFRSFFYIKNDTMAIDGLYGLFGGFGFSINLIGEKAIVYHLLAGDDFPAFSMTKGGNLKLRIEVPCTKTQVILSKFPDPKAEDEIIYGMVEFESGEYYQMSGFAEGKEIGEREKIRMNMKIYFKAKFLDIEDLK